MSTEHNTAETSDPAPDAVVAAPESVHRADSAAPSADSGHINGEAALRDWEGLPADTGIIIPTFVTPMRQPENTWALLVQAVDIIGDFDNAEEVELFVGDWLRDQPPADLFDGDLVVRVTPLDDTVVAVDVEMLLARHSRWHRVGVWLHLGTAWPVILAPTAATVMELSTGVTELSARQDAAAPSVSPLAGSDRGAVSALLDVGLVKPGDEFLWERRNNSVRHIARIRADGAVVLADGRVFATPSGAATALCGYGQNGWGVFRRVSDGRSLADLRRALRAQRGQ
ncbi:hypothetical protein BA062_36205 [Prauserella flavalba]|uniref:RAMA domain-containing protein n=2 Tax=Prauserella flavalba TaxID=1477506 RepID=A0A318LG51_9PSEU|nr:hypothetical protein BA062_36205 [Prauserella flavalba]